MIKLLCYLEGELTMHTFLIFLHLLAVHGARVGAIYLMQLTFFENDYPMKNIESNLELAQFFVSM